MAFRRVGRAIVLIALCFVVFQAGAAYAQDSLQTTMPQRRVIAWTNPILFVFTWYMAEAEIRLEKNHTVGASLSYLQTDTDSPGDPDYEENSYFSASFFYRYYPTAAFKGFFIGAQVGTAQVSSKDNFDDESGSAMSAGVLIGYGWLLGEAQRIGVSIGIGANRFFGGDVPDDATAVLPVIRLINVGVAF